MTKFYFTLLRQKSLMAILVCFLFAIKLPVSNGQVGLRFYGQVIRFNPWEQVSSRATVDHRFSLTGYQAGIDYWFRLKNHRVEFMPELQYARQLSLRVDDKSSTLHSFGFELNTHFYLMDFYDDCDCPTWSKSGEWFEKGFFLILSPGVHYFQYPSIRDFEGSNQWVGSISLGAGLDIGFSDFLTLTPVIKWRHWITPQWSGLSDLLQNSTPDISRFERRYFQQFQIGFRLGFRIYS